MSVTVVGSGPVEFMNSTGNQVSIPLTALHFTSGTLSLNQTVWTPTIAAGDLTNLNNLLLDLQNQQLITQEIS
jgi:hypothetical protein